MATERTPLQAAVDEFLATLTPIDLCITHDGWSVVEGDCPMGEGLGGCEFVRGYMIEEEDK